MGFCLTLLRNDKPHTVLVKSVSLYFCQDPNIPPTPEAEEEDRILESYLINMKVDQGQLKLPPNSELPNGFELFYQRRSLRRTYHFPATDGEQFALTVCKDQATDVNTDQRDEGSFDETEVKVRITTIKLCFLFVLVSSLPLFLL